MKSVPEQNGVREILLRDSIFHIIIFRFGIVAPNVLIIMIQDGNRGEMGSITIKATYDGSSFRVLEPVDLEPDTEYIITVEKVASKKNRACD